MNISVTALVKGASTFIPGAARLVNRRGGGGTNSASYCYGVWLKHLVMLRQNGMREMPNTLAELGPGASLGVGLAAMLSGVNKYYALDVVKYSNIDFNLQILDELVALFRARTPRPTKGWPDFDAYLDPGLFPSHILDERWREECLSQERIQSIQSALEHPGQQDRTTTIRYMVPWDDASVIDRGSVDLIISHSVLEHVADLQSTYSALKLWLKDGGLMSHQIDFESHGLSQKWNGHRAYPEMLWKIVVGKRPFLLNRQPYSTHAALLKANGFEPICDMKNYRSDGVERSDLAAQWTDMTDDDLTCSGAFIQVRKPQRSI